jgi:hypothetical protein
VDFTQTEIRFYGAVFLVASIACLFRVFRDNEFASSSAILGRCLSSGVFAFGGIAIWVGSHPPAPDGSGFYFLAVAAFVGLLDKELQTKLIEWIVGWFFKRIGGPGDVGK